MLIDNKNNRYPEDGLGIKTVWDFIHKYAVMPQAKGNLDIVTGYFTLRALSKLHQEIPADDTFHIISSEMVKPEDETNHVIDLLNGDKGFDTVFELEQYAKDAIAFLQRDTVQIRAITNSFCHAKAYIYTAKDASKGDFYLTGSSNLTDAGLGLKASSNLELTIGQTCNRTNADFKELRTWFSDAWKVAHDTIPVDPKNPRSRCVPVKEYFINQIKDFFRKYSPEEVYYKILFELFNADLDLDSSIEHKQDMSLLQTSVIWKTLFNYQQKGVISLIKMLRKYNGAILADAVGLGKTFSALGVIKYFQTQNYQTVLLCPKKLEQNWSQYLRRRGSRFEADEFDYLVRFHTDLQDDRLQNRYEDARLSWLQNRPKLLIVIDESHNLRNEKSSRYSELLGELIQNRPGQQNRDVKVLMLSATPINTGLNDVKGQFNLIGHGVDGAFKENFDIASLRNMFATAQREYKAWCNDPNRTVGGFISKLPQKFFSLTDKLIVARTRNLIEKTLGENLGFPQKEHPDNEYCGVEHFGSFNTAEEIYKAFDGLSLSAYQPSLFIPAPKDKQKDRKKQEKEWGTDVNRERFLVKMMGIMFLKRLESSWHSCLATVSKVLKVHEDTLTLVQAYQQSHRDSKVNAGTLPGVEDEEDEIDFSLSKGSIKLSEMKNLEGFKRAISADIKKLKVIVEGLQDFQRKYEARTERDPKLDKLEALLREKQSKPNRKALIFTAYTDTAQFLYEELRKRGFERIAFVSGSEAHSSYGYSGSDYQGILQRFAPYSKLYRERDWRDLYEHVQLDRAKYFDDAKGWQVPYDIWTDNVRLFDENASAVLNEPVDILIATDCLSEGQNLQDADLQINYDIHWNPVRLVQRFGRIDRIGSPNERIKCVNFWPAESFDAYLKLEGRVTNRMAAMAVVGAEIPEELNDSYNQMVEDNPLIDKNAARLLREFSENSISDIESQQTLSFSDFSFEVYRQDLVDYFERNKEVFRRMPSGIFSGFAFDGNTFDKMTDSLVAVIGYPHREEGENKPYTSIYLMCQPANPKMQAVYRELNRAEVLEFLRRNKNAQRAVPEWIETNDSTRLSRLSDIVCSWLQEQVPQQAGNEVLGIMQGAVNRNRRDNALIEDKFKYENCDLIVWEYVTSDK